MNRKNILLKAFVMTVLIAFLAAGSCASEKAALSYRYNDTAGTVHPYPGVTFAVISDLHLYDPSLGTSGSAFEKTMNSDRKLLLDSIDLLDYAVESIVASGVDFVIIPGDLTKDGELINHRLAAEKLKTFTENGIAVYVIPGNHDVNNPGSVSYDGDGTKPVPAVSAADFSEIYGAFGYGSAILHDDDSLSYMAEPADGLWLLAIDACRYRENVPGHEEIVSGKISQKTADWIASALQKAENENKAVMAIIHHGVVEHWKGQSKLHPDYLISDYADFGKFLASWNVRAVFTGHYHALDIVRGEFDNKFIYDIETGSLITAPCPIRYIDISNNIMRIRTETIVDKIHPGTDFAVNAHAFVKKTVKLEAESVLRRYKVPLKDTDYISDAVGDAFTAHYRGDEDPALRPSFNKKQLGLWGRVVYGQQQYVLDGLWADLYPADINVSLDLSPR